MQKIRKTTKIILTGGGTGGSVTPLLAIAEDIKEAEFLFIGTKDGMEKEMVEIEKINFRAIPYGKLRRYFSWNNFIDPFFILAGFFKALILIVDFKPKLVITAGSFVGVPVVWAAWLLRVPVLVHQQDVRPGLANKLMSPFAKKITVTFEKSLLDYGNKAIWTGNPTRRSLRSDSLKLRVDNSSDAFSSLPTVLILGGGTGALPINEIIFKSLDELVGFCRVIHQMGKKKGFVSVKNNYISYEFLHAKQLAGAYSAADIIISRCGMGTLTELSYLGKPAILIPIPDSHQEDNAKAFNEKGAAIVLNQKELTPERLVLEIKKLLADKKSQEVLGSNIRTMMKMDANESIVKIIREMV